MSLNGTIKQIIENLTPETIYLRAATLNEANVELPQIVINKPIAIHAALPTITHTQNEANLVRLVPVQILFLQKNSSQDDNGEEIDAILDGLLPLVNQFYADLRATINPTQEIETYTLDAIPAYQFSDEVLTGWSLQIEYPELISSQCPRADIVYNFLNDNANGFADSGGTNATWALNNTEGFQATLQPPTNATNRLERTVSEIIGNKPKITVKNRLQYFSNSANPPGYDCVLYDNGVEVGRYAMNVPPPVAGGADYTEDVVFELSERITGAIGVANEQVPDVDYVAGIPRIERITISFSG